MPVDPCLARTVRERELGCVPWDGRNENKDHDEWTGVRSNDVKMYRTSPAYIALDNKGGEFIDDSRILLTMYTELRGDVFCCCYH